MSDNPITNVNRIESQTIKAVQAQVHTPQVVQQIQQQIESIAPERVNQTARDEQAKMHAHDAHQETAKETREPKEPEETKKETPLSSRETSLRFRVNAETNEVTMMIVDRASDKVIATIPPEAIKDLPAGELFQYSA